MSKVKEIDRRSVGAWLSSDLGQSMPEFTTSGSAGYGVTRKPYFITTGSERINVAPVNNASDDYARNVTALSGIGRVTGVSSISSYDRSLSGLSGAFDTISNGFRSAWGSIASGASAVFDAAKQKGQAVINYITDPSKFVNDLANNVPGAQRLTQGIVDDLKKTQDNLYRLYNLIQTLRKMGTKSPVPMKTLDEWDRGRNKTVSDWVSSCYVMYSVPAIANQMARSGVTKPNISEGWVLSAVQAGTISSKVYNKIKESNKTGALAGLGEPLSTAAIALIVIGALGTIAGIAYIMQGLSAKAIEEARAASDKALVESMKAAGASPAEIEKALLNKKKAELLTDKERNKAGMFASLGQWLPWAVGGVLVIALLPTITALGKRGATALQR